MAFMFGDAEQWQEAQREYQDRRDRAEMEYQDSAHAIMEWLQAMSHQELTHFRHVMSAIMNDEKNAAAIARYWIGIVVAIDQIRHNHCSVCDKNHDEALSELVGPDDGTPDA